MFLSPLIHHQDVISPSSRDPRSCVYPPLVDCLPAGGQAITPPCLSAVQDFGRRAAYFSYASVVAPPAYISGIYDAALPLFSGI